VALVALEVEMPEAQGQTLFFLRLLPTAEEQVAGALHQALTEQVVALVAVQALVMVLGEQETRQAQARLKVITGATLRRE
jgi:hypothetical protein